MQTYPPTNSPTNSIAHSPTHTRTAPPFSLQRQWPPLRRDDQALAGGPLRRHSHRALERRAGRDEGRRPARLQGVELGRRHQVRPCPRCQWLRRTQRYLTLLPFGFAACKLGTQPTTTECPVSAACANVEGVKLIVAQWTCNHSMRKCALWRIKNSPR